jgi:hypothetical protein
LTTSCHASFTVAASIGLSLPAGIDFACHELYWRYKSTNIRRSATGLLFGLAVGVIVFWHRIVPSVSLLAFLLVMQLVIVLAFRLTGRLDAYVERYEKGAMVQNGNAITP